MIPLRRQILIRAFKLFDLVVLVLSLFLAASLISYPQAIPSLAELLSMRVSVQSVLFVLTFMALWHIIFSLFMLYRSRRLSSPWEEVFDVCKATTVGTFLLFVMAKVMDVGMVTPSFLLAFWALSSLITVLSRLTLRLGLSRLRSGGRNLRFILIVGTNHRAVQIAKEVDTKPGLGYRLLGFVDEEWHGSPRFRKTGYPLISDFDGFASVVRDEAVDEVWIGLPMKTYSRQISEIVALCQKIGIITRLLPGSFSPKLAQWKAESFQGNPVLTQYPASMIGTPVIVKRVMDISIASIVLLSLAPLLLSISLLIKVTSRGPVFFIQERVGLNRRRFHLFKFRTMEPDAEQKQAQIEHLNEVEGPVFKIKNDPRITKIGRFLRKTSMDELPQLFNVLKGDMSLVGPRPLPVRDYRRFYQDKHRRRFSVPPGLTCLWQVNGRHAVSFEEWMNLDLQYIDQWSLDLDFKILLKTIPAVFKGSGS